MSRDILDQIDHALTDNQISGDAMRWSPDQSAPDPAMRGPHGPLTEFLLARIAEDEGEIHYLRNVGVRGAQYGSINGTLRHVIERALADCKAKREILEARRRLEAAMESDDPLGLQGDGAQSYTLDWVLLRLALPYAEHPDYDEAWRP